MFARKTNPLLTCCRCGLAYDAKYVAEPYRHLCPEHRKEPMERDAKIAEVKGWAERNWEKLYEQAKTENAAFAQSNISGYSQYLSQMAQAQKHPQNLWSAMTGL